MLRKFTRFTLVLGLLFSSFWTRPAPATVVELFANGSLSKNYLATDSWVTSLSTGIGMAVVVIPHLRIEGRYTNISSLQNQLNAAVSGVTVNLSNIKTTTTMYTLGVNIDFLSEKSPFQPYIYLGGGYVDTERSYYASLPGQTDSQYIAESPQRGLSANAGLGIRLRIAQQIALELEAYAYAEDVQTKHPLVNIYGTAGIRIFI